MKLFSVVIVPSCTEHICPPVLVSWHKKHPFAAKERATVQLTIPALLSDEITDMPFSVYSTVCSTYTWGERNTRPW
jgi:hypothetical protein